MFRLTPHIKRLFHSAKIFMIDIPFTRGRARSRRPRRRCGSTASTSCYIRPLVYLGYGEMGLNPLPCPVNVSIAVWPWGAYLGDEGIKHGVRMKISSWQRHDPNAMPPAAKGTGMYINSSMAKVEAHQGRLRRGDPAVAAGLRERVHRREHLHRQGRRDHHAAGRAPARSRASPRTRCARSPATSASSTARRNILRTDLYTADEAFLSGTAAEVVPIRSVDDREIGEPGPITRKIQEMFFAAVRGEVDRYKDWIEHVRLTP